MAHRGYFVSRVLSSCVLLLLGGRPKKYDDHVNYMCQDCKSRKKVAYSGILSLSLTLAYPPSDSDMEVTGYSQTQPGAILHRSFLVSQKARAGARSIGSGRLIANRSKTQHFIIKGSRRGYLTYKSTNPIRDLSSIESLRTISTSTVYLEGRALLLPYVLSNPKTSALRRSSDRQEKW